MKNDKIQYKWQSVDVEIMGARLSFECRILKLYKNTVSDSTNEVPLQVSAEFLLEILASVKKN